VSLHSKHSILERDQKRLQEMFKTVSLSEATGMSKPTGHTATKFFLLNPHKVTPVPKLRIRTLCCEGTSLKMSDTFITYSADEPRKYCEQHELVSK
jgi:hypothetical protein